MGDMAVLGGADLRATMASVDLAACSAESLADLMDRALAAQREATGWVNRVATEARRRERAGSATTAEDVARSAGAVSAREARLVARRADLGDTLPALADYIDTGNARPENADAVANRLDSLDQADRAAVAAHDNEIADRAASLPPETFTRWLGRLIRETTAPDPDQGLSRAERQRAASGFGLKRQADGMWRLWGDLDDERGTELNDILTRTARHLAGAGEPVTANTRAAALHHLATRTGTGDDEPTAHMGIGYLVDATTLAAGPHDGSVAQRWHGDDTDPATVARLACDTDLYAVLYDQLGQPTKVGRTRRAATKAQRLQLRGLYDACPLDGTPFADCEIHHVNLPWEAGGHTELDNLLPLSRTWHHRIHDRGWHLKMRPDRSLELWRPDGTLDRGIPPPQPLTRQHE